MKIKFNKKILYLASFLVLVFALFGCVKILNYRIADPKLIIRDEKINEEILRRKIDGQEFNIAENLDLFPVAIMVENSADSWPLAGLDKANIVIEAITESSIPRFVAIFANNQNIEKIGPVRSARPYYLDWIEPFQPVYMHVGGAPEALKMIKSSQYELNDLDQFFNSEYYWRDKWRYAPHNVYTSSELIQRALETEGLNNPVDYQMWQYKKDDDFDKRPEKVNDVIISYSNNYYQVKWQYDRNENNYLRYQGKKIQKLVDGNTIKSKNIVVQINKMYVIDEVGRKKITTIGENLVWVFRDGHVTEGTWEKESPEKRIKYFDNNDNEIKFNGGTTWIEVIPEKEYLEY